VQAALHVQLSVSAVTGRPDNALSNQLSLTS